MCNQAVSLVGAELERQGVSTVVLQLLRFVAERVHAPRALFVPFRHGFPLGRPDDVEGQHRVIGAALRLLDDRVVEPPVLRDLEPRDFERQPRSD